MLYTDSVQAPQGDATGGFRILVTRFRGRFLPKSAYDVWMPNLGPSEKLLRRILKDEISWTGFSRAYRQEMLGAGTTEPGNRVIRNHGQKYTLRLLARLAAERDVVLLCHCAREEPHCHRHLLAELIRKAG